MHRRAKDQINDSISKYVDESIDKVREDLYKAISKKIIRNKPTQQKNTQKKISIKKTKKSYKKVSFIELSANDADLGNIISTLNFPIPLKIKNDIYELENASYDKKNISACILIDLYLDYSNIKILIDEPLAKSLIGSFADPKNINNIPEKIRIALYNHILEETLEQIEKVTVCSCKIESISNIEKVVSPKSSYAFWISKNQKKLGRIFVKFSESAKRTIIESKQISNYYKKNNIDRTIPSNLIFEIGRQTLPIEDFKKLEENDILIIGKYQPKKPSPITIRLDDNYCFNGLLINNKIKFESHLEINMDNLVNGDSIVDSDSHFEKISVNLSFDIGNRTLPLSEIKKIRPGFTLELDSEIERPVTIRANKFKIGHGEIVSIGKRLGVRILELDDGTIK